MVYCPLPNNEEYGFIFENENVTGSTNERMLCYFLFPKLLGYPKNMIFQQGGAPPLYSCEVLEYLNRKLSNLWMGRYGPVSWPARSPDLTPCKYFLCGSIKQVYQEPFQNINKLRNKTRQAVATRTQDTSRKIYANMKFRLSFVVQEQRRLFKHILD